MSAVERHDASLELDDQSLVPVRYPRASAGGVAANVCLGIFGALFATPLLWMVLSSVDAHASWSIHVPTLTLGNYSALMHEATLRPLWNSMYLAGLSTIVTTVLAVMSAYVLSRSHVPLKRTFLFFILFASGSR